MELINDIQIEVTQMVIRTNSLLGKRRIFEFKRLIFMANIDEVGEEAYLVENNYNTCGVLMLKSGEWIKVKESYEELKSIHTAWWKRSAEESERIMESKSIKVNT